MKRISFIIFLININVINIFGQDQKIIYSNPLNSSLFIWLNGGATYSLSDYNNPGVGKSYNFNLAYFFPSGSKLAYGLFFTASTEELTGKQNYLGFPDKFNTVTKKIGGGILFSYSLNRNLFPILKAGASHSWFKFSNPPTYSKLINVYSDDLQKSWTLDFEPGINLKLSEFIGLQFWGGIHFVVNDNFDAVKFGNHNDFFLTGKIGISFKLFSDADFDHDGIPDSEDKCIDIPEDKDGYEDFDGCPDYDNDNDGIPDSVDKCPFTKEDFDGFEDEDGCPELDNDNDGILDAQDKCPDNAEDLDGFEDQDGCPDYDNDNDSIPDSLDKCPDAAEVFNNYQDEDGCPDSVPVELIKEKIKQEPKVKREPVPDVFLLHSETTFEGQTSIIKPSALSRLNRIARLIKQYPYSKWRIEAHSDSKRNPLEAIKITQRQAEAIKLYLVSKGLPGKNLIAIGMGDSVPIASNKFAYGRLKNRRIKIVRIK